MIRCYSRVWHEAVSVPFANFSRVDVYDAAVEKSQPGKMTELGEELI